MRLLTGTHIRQVQQALDRPVAIICPCDIQKMCNSERPATPNAQQCRQRPRQGKTARIPHTSRLVTIEVTRSRNSLQQVTELPMSHGTAFPKPNCACSCSNTIGAPATRPRLMPCLIVAWIEQVLCVRSCCSKQLSPATSPGRGGKCAGRFYRYRKTPHTKQQVSETSRN